MRIPSIVSAIFFLALCSPVPAADSGDSVVPIVAVAATAGNDRLPPAGPGPNGGWNPVFSPDGSRIAFLSSTLHTPADLWVMKVDGSAPKRLTSRGVKGFSWTEDGTAIRIQTVRKGFVEILSINVDHTANAARVPGLPPGASLPVYSPDNSLFAVTVPGEQRIRDLWIGTADGERLDAVTEKIGIRSVFWHPDSRKIYYEAGGGSYGVGIWEMDLATMESKSLLANYIGTPVYSSRAGLIAFPFPTNPGEFEVRTMKLDGAEVTSHYSPRLPGKMVAWDAAGQGVYYLGQDIEKIVPAEKGVFAGMFERLKGLFAGEKEKDAAGNKKGAAADKDAENGPPLHNKAVETFRRVGVTALWHLDFATNVETRVSPAELHLVDFSLSPEGGKAVLAGVLEDSFNTELFSLDLAAGEMTRLTRSRGSSWLPTPSFDSSSIAFFTNEGGGDTLKVVDRQGKETAAYPGIALETDTRIFRLPASGGLLIYSGRGLVAFTEEKGAIGFPSRKDHRTFLGLDVSIQADKVLLNAVPRHGETPGLYMLEAVDNTFVETDLRYPQAAEEAYAPELYMQPRWSLDGTKIAFTDRTDVWTMNADNTGRKWITNYRERNQDEKNKPALASYPVWSSRGDRLCYTLTVYDQKTIHRQLWIVMADGSEAKMLHSQAMDSQFQVYLPEYTNLPFFDYDDEKIIFTIPDNGVPNIYAVAIKDGALHRLTEDGAIFPALLPEEGVILYTSLAENNEKLMSMNVDGTGKRAFTVERRKAE
jgi:Tol biopolymer transport system component